MTGDRGSQLPPNRVTSFMDDPCECKNRYQICGSAFEYKNYLRMLYSQWITEMAKAGASQYSFHIEATDNVVDCIQSVKAANMKVGEYLACNMFLNTFI